MTGTFSPSSLFFLKSGGTQTITFTASSPTSGEYSGFQVVSQGLYRTNITGQFIERSTSGCTLQITVSPSTGTTNEQYLCSFYVSDGQTLVKQEFGLEIINVPDTFTPPSDTIIFPNSGGTQTVRCETEDAVDNWQIVGIYPTFSIMRINNIVSASTYVDFDINILENDLAGAQGEIRVQKMVKNTPLSNMYYFTIGDFTVSPVSPTTFDFTGGTKTIECTANFGTDLDFSVVENIDWITCSVDNSSNRNATITIVADNNTGIARSGNIVIQYGSLTQNYGIFQAAYVEPSKNVTITPDSLTFDHTGGTQTINCSADYGDGLTYSVINNTNWANAVVNNSSNRNATITVNTQFNTGIARSGNIVIKYGNDFSQTYYFNQKKYVEPTGNVTISPKSPLTFNHTGGSQQIVCVADYGDGLQDFSVSENIDWATISVDNSTDRKGIITVSATTNTGIARSGNIVIKYGNNFEESYGIQQSAYVEPSGNVTITPEKLQFEDTGGTQQITCIADYGDGMQDFSVSENIDWVTCSVDNSTDRKGIITVVADKNLSVARSGNIVIKYGNNFSQSYGIFQNAKKNVTITPSSLSFDYSGGTQNINCSANYGSGLTYSVSENVDWLTCSVDNTSDRNATISVISTKNTGNQRSANITISYGNDFSEVYTINQAAYVEPTGNVTITPASPLKFDHTGGTQTITCVADYGDGLQEFSITGSISWVKSINVDNTSNRNATITVVVDDWNLANTARTGNFTIKYGNNFSEVYTITQKKYTEPTGNVTITPASPLKFDHTGGTKTIECVADYGDGLQEFSINGSISWADISIKNTSDRNATITVNTQFNTGIARSGNIVIKYGNNFEESYGIQQSAYVEPTGNVTITPKSPLNFKSSGGTQTITCVADYGDGLQEFSIDHSIDWATITLDKSNRKGVITVVADKNLSVARSGNIVITYGKNFETNYGIQQDRNIPGSIVADPDTINAVFAEISGTCILTIVNTSGITATSSADWVTCSISNNKLIYNISENTTNKNREATITIKGIDINLNTPVVETVSIFQSYYNIYAICQDTEFEYDTTYNYLTYTINDGDNVVYSGRAYKLPNSAFVKFNVNKLVSDYVNSELPNEFPSDNLCKLYTLDNYYKNFIIKNSLGNELGSFNFFNDWSYDFNRVDQRFDENGYVKISDPIKKVISRNQYFLYSVFLPYQLSNVDYNINYKLENDNGKNVNRITQNLDKSTQYLIIDNTLQNYPNYNKINVNGDIFKIVDNCYEYVLYYQNAYGGWDSLLVQGNVVKSDSITSYSYSKAFNNTTIEFEKKKYTNVIQTKYQMYTDYLTDEESSKMHHLFESCEIYLHNLFTNQIMPVNITDSSFDYKTFKNQGKKLYYYTFNLEVAQEKLRK